MVKERKIELLEMAAECFEDSRNPFETSVLVEHNVTSQECFDLSEDIALIIRGYLNSPTDIRLQVAMCGAIEGTNVDRDVMLAMFRKNEAMKKLKSV